MKRCFFFITGLIALSIGTNSSFGQNDYYMPKLVHIFDNIDYESNMDTIDSDFKTGWITYASVFAPIGWSMNGNLAYIKGDMHESIDFVVHDLINDTILFREQFWFGSPGEPMGSSEFSVDSLLTEYNIEQDYSFQLEQFPIKLYEDWRMDEFELFSRSDIKRRDAGDYADYNIKFVLSSKNRGNKTVYKKVIYDWNLTDLSINGIIRSPYDDRFIAVIYSYKTYRGHADNLKTFQIFGVNLVEGFSW